MKGPKTRLIEVTHTHTPEIDSTDKKLVIRTIKHLVANDDELEKLLKATHKDRVAVLKKNGYKFKK